MKQFLLPFTPSPESKTLELTGKDFHYLCHVRRLVPGDTIRALDGNGFSYLLEMTNVNRDNCHFIIREREKRADHRETKITLFQALPKGKKMDQIVRQATEAGVSTIVPLESDHSLVKLTTPKDRAAKRERWERIVKEALQQSGSSFGTVVEEPSPFLSLKDFPGSTRKGFFCHQDREGDGLILPVLSSSTESIRELGILIGPEGGLSPKEVDNLKNWGYDSVWFGDNVLRAETASIYAVAALKTILREMF
ncbi:MAG: 16S rRNA (uracil(1498)-N(3))-methyltransferase [Spirochaetales bacterium]|nr:16S rRNA (uracil(1498)-N(3))-methyltransferase [Spirochaetales bacterium]